MCMTAPFRTRAFTSRVAMLAPSVLSLRACSSLRSFANTRHIRLPQARRVGVRCTCGSSTNAFNSKDPKPKITVLDRVVDKLNDSIQRYPGETIAVLFTSDILSIGAMYGVIRVAGIEFSPEFALAFAASRPFRRFRLPLDLIVASGVARVFPVFSQVRLSDLTRALPKCGAILNALQGMKRWGRQWNKQH